MSELELTLRYKSTPARLAMGTILLGLPVWGMAGPLVLVFLIVDSATAILRGNLTWFGMMPLDFWQTLLGAMALTFLGSMSALYFGDNTLIATKEGIAFPRFVFKTPLSLFSRQRTWGEITTLKIQGNPRRPVRERQLVFTFDGSPPLKLNMAGMTDEDLEKLLLAADVWGSHIDRGADLVILHESLQSANNTPKQLSYTAMWEEELGRRFSSTSFVPLEPGKTLCEGRLKVIRQLAFGGLSAIYLAQHCQRDLVVLKEAVTPSGCDEATRSKAREMFQREARFLIRLRHQHIAKVFDNFTEAGRDYLLIEFVNGQDLRQLVRQNGVQAEATIVSWAVLICDILSYLHGQEPPLVHRDLTPDNLVLSQSEGIKLIDFGAANEFVGTATGTLVGKQAYIAPEQFRGKAVTQSDIYALGCTMYFLATGSDPDALAISHPRSLQPDLAPGFDLLVADLTAIEAARRPQSAAEVKERLLALLSPDAVAVDSRSDEAPTTTVS
jgi:tRNA A-37 threonylcarbamoyl transferase component Bud32